MSSFIKKMERLYGQRAIEAIDLERCRFFQQQYPEVDSEVLKAVFLVGYRYQRGDICASLDAYAGQPLLEDDETVNGFIAPELPQWKQSLAESPIVGLPGDFTPLILDSGNHLYFQKFWRQEEALAQSLLNRCEQRNDIDDSLLKDGLNRLFGTEKREQPDWQKVAAALSVRNKLSVISGGPGTGKTTTVVRILALLVEQSRVSHQPAAIALAAPTGKAAARLKESVRTAKRELVADDETKRLIPDEAQTLHQLLGARRHSSQFRYNEQNLLPYKTVVVDEVSMVDQPLMSRLMKALPENARLILLGDKDQLASVEAGSVLGDICLEAENKFSTGTKKWLKTVSITLPDKNVAEKPSAINDYITLLTKSYRFTDKSGIDKLAKNINSGSADETLQILESGRFEGVRFSAIKNYAELQKKLEEITIKYIGSFFKNINVEKAFAELQKFQLLAVHRRGPFGIRFLNRQIEQILIRQKLVPKHRQWYAGKPVIININDYNLGLFNGDIGICLPNNEGKLRVYFQQKDEIREIAPARLPDHSSAYALTVHKGQGAEFENIGLILPLKESKVLSRELLYTAVTRARKSVNIIGSKTVLTKAVKKRLKRSSGLADHIRKA